MFEHSSYHLLLKYNYFLIVCNLLEKEVKSTKRKSGAGDGSNSDEDGPNSDEKVTPEKKPKLDEEVAEVEQNEEVEAAV